MTLIQTHRKKLQIAVNFRGLRILILNRVSFSLRKKKSLSLSFEAYQSKSICLRIVILHGQQHKIHMNTEKNCRRLQLLGKLQY